MPLPSFIVTGSVFDLLGNVASNELTPVGLGAGRGGTKVTFTPNVPHSQLVTREGAAYRVNPVTATVNSTDGQIVRGGQPVRLLANDPGLSITGLQWQIAIAGIAPFWIDAPTDGGSVDIATVAPAAAASVTALASLPVAGLSDATPFAKGLLTGAADAAAARGAIGALSQAEIENLIGSYEAETLALIGRMAVRPDATHRSAINTLIVALKTAGIWAKLDGLHLLAAHTEQAALLNWVTAARDLTSFNTPTFTADRGITGGGTSYLATSSSFSGAGLLMDDGDESIGVWVRTNVVDNSANSVTLATNNSGGSTVRYINPRNASTVVAWKMNFATTQGSLPHASGDNTLYVATRNPTDAYLYFNGAQDDSFTAAISDDPRALSMWFLVGRTATAYSTRQHCAGFYGRYLNASEQAQLYNALLDYMTALGAV